MASSLTVYGNVPNTLDLINSMGVAIAKSRLLGCENEDQGRVIAMTCIVRGVDPLTLAQKFDIIKGKLAMKAANMLAEFRMLGGRHKILERSPDACAITLSLGGESETFRITWDEISTEDYVKTKDGKLKDNYSSPRRRMQMMWARLISDAVRAMAPEVNAGVYTPEEVGDYQDATIIDAEVVPAAASVTRDTVGQAPQSDTFASQPGPAFAAAENLATGEQINTLNELFKALQVPADKQTEAIRKRGAKDMGDLTEEQAANLIEALLAKAKAVAETEQQAEAMAGEVQVEPDAKVLPTSSKCIESQVGEIKALMREISQMTGQADIGPRVKEKLARHGLSQLADLTYDDAEKIKAVLAKKNLEAFFDMDLKPVNF